MGRQLDQRARPTGAPRHLHRLREEGQREERGGREEEKDGGEAVTVRAGAHRLASSGLQIYIYNIYI